MNPAKMSTAHAKLSALQYRLYPVEILLLSSNVASLIIYHGKQDSRASKRPKEDEIKRPLTK